MGTGNIGQYPKASCSAKYAYLDKSVIFTTLLRIFAIFGMVSFGIVIYAVYFEDPFIEYQNLPFPVKGPVEQGKYAPISIERCNGTKNTRIYISSRALKSKETGKEITLPESTVSMKTGCSNVTSRSVIIPYDTIPGTYTIEGEAYAQGLLRQHRVPWYTEEFQVVKARGLAEQLREEARQIDKQNESP